MAKYIYQNAAIAIADYAADEHPYDKDPERPETYSDYNQGWNDACDYIRGKIENMPVTGGAPVRHGRWGVDGVYVVCSVCNRFTLSPILKRLQTFKYCPNCGAKMDGGNDG